MRYLDEEGLRERWSAEVIDLYAAGDSGAIARAIGDVEIRITSVLAAVYGMASLPATPQAAADTDLPTLVADAVPMRLAQIGGFDAPRDDVVMGEQRTKDALHEIAMRRADIGLVGEQPVDRSATLGAARPSSSERPIARLLEGW